MNKLIKIGTFTSLFTLALTVAMGDIAQAEEVYRLEPVVVTSEKRVENVQDIPASISVISEQEVKDAGIKSIKDVARYVPNLFIANWGVRGVSNVFIRGIGAISNSPAVGFYVDDVSYMDYRMFDSMLFDIERVEVLRGPQGTLYGVNSIGGVINIVTKKPDNEMHFGLEQTFGSYNQFETAVYARMPLIDDKLFLSFSGAMDKRDGYVTNDFRNDDVDNRDGFNGRAQLRYIPTSKLDITLSVDGEKTNDGAYPMGEINFVDANPQTINYNVEGKDKRDILGSSLRIAYEAPWFDLTSITSYRGYDSTTSNDQDFGVLDLLVSSEKYKDRQFSQELRFASLEDSGPLKWLVGAYAYSHVMDQNLEFNYGAQVGGFDTESKSDIFASGFAIFGQGTYTFFDKLDLTLGLRYGHDKTDINFKQDMIVGGNIVPNVGGISINANDTKGNGVLLPKAQIAYNWTPDFMTYAGITRGYRKGGFNPFFIDPNDFSFDPEYSWNYEAGFKSAWFDNRVNFNASLFYIDLQDQQVTQILPNANTIIANAGKAESLGFELEASALIIEGLLLDGSFGYTKSTYKEYSGAPAGQNYDGNKTPLAPEYTYNVALQYSLPLVDFELMGKDDSLIWTSRAEVQGIGKFYWDSANDLEQDPYALVNLRTGLETGNYSVIFWVNNIFDQKYNVMALTFTQLQRTFAQVGAPRTIGVTFRVDF